MGAVFGGKQAVLGASKVALDVVRLNFMRGPGCQQLEDYRWTRAGHCTTGMVGRRNIHSSVRLKSLIDF